MPEKKNFKLRPLEDRVLVERVEETETPVSGIILPESSSKKPKKARVVAVGKGKMDANGKLIPVEVKVGDIVLLEDWGVTEVDVEGKEYFILDQSRILAVYED